MTALSDGAPYKLPAQLPFTTFQKLEKTSDPEFMEAAIDYAEAYRGVKDLVKLARLTKQTVAVSTKEPGKPRKETQVCGTSASRPPRPLGLNSVPLNDLGVETPL